MGKWISYWWTALPLSCLSTAPSKFQIQWLKFTRVSYSNKFKYFSPSPWLNCYYWIWVLLLVHHFIFLTNKVGIHLLLYFQYQLFGWRIFTFGSFPVFYHSRDCHWHKIQCFTTGNIPVFSCWFSIKLEKICINEVLKYTKIQFLINFLILIIYI